MGVCRLYSHLLLVLDDDEMYKEQTPLSLTQARAVATSLNRWVHPLVCAVIVIFDVLCCLQHLPSDLSRCYCCVCIAWSFILTCPSWAGPAAAERRAAWRERRLSWPSMHLCYCAAYTSVTSGGLSTQANVSGWASVFSHLLSRLLLSCLLSEAHMSVRQHRRGFCQPLLWLAPYNEMYEEEVSSSSRQGGLSAAWQLATANMSLPALLDAAFHQQPLLGGGGSGMGSGAGGTGERGAAQPALAASATVGTFSAAAVIQSLMPGGTGSSGEGEAEALQVRQGQGRSKSMAGLGE